MREIRATTASTREGTTGAEMTGTRAMGSTITPGETTTIRRGIGTIE